MKKYVYKLSLVTSLSVALLIAACGGGGGSAGAVAGAGGGSTGGGTTTTSKSPTLTLTLTDSLGTKTNSIGSSGSVNLKIKLTDPSGNPIGNQKVSLVSSANNILLSGSAAYTSDTTGEASISVTRTSSTSTGDGNIIATFDFLVNGSLKVYPDGSAVPTVDTAFTRIEGYVIAESTASKLTLDTPILDVATPPAYSTANVSVTAKVDNVVTSSPVQVSFTSTCGVVVPSTVTTTSSGVASTSFSAVNVSDVNDQGCGGKSVTITASSPGLSGSVEKTFQVLKAASSNIQFVSASPSVIYLAGSSGASQSNVAFKVFNAQNKPAQGELVNLNIENSANLTVPRVSFGTQGNTQQIQIASDSNGMVSVPVFAGTIPTSAVIVAELNTNKNIKTNSNQLAVASGLPVQSRTSLAVDLFSVQGRYIDGMPIKLSFTLADRQGNPVPDGTSVNFVSEAGVLEPPTCATVNSRCASTLSSNGSRPSDGLVTVLAYTPGEEDFSDLNGNNVHDVGEQHTDLGNAYLDSGSIGGQTAFNSNYIFYPFGNGTSTCGGGYMGKPNTCDGVWGKADVRQHTVVVWSDGEPALTKYVVTTGLLTVDVADSRGNSLPTGSVISVTATDNTTANGITCTVDAQSHDAVPPMLFKFELKAWLKDCVTGDAVKVKITNPKVTVPITGSVGGGSRTDTFPIPSQSP